MDKDKQQKIEKRLAAIAKRHGGALRPDDVVDDARDPKSPLHDQFEWDDSVAAHKYRISQARTLIKTVTIEVKVEHREVVVPRYVRDPSVGERQGYADVFEIKNEQELARDALRAEVKRVRSLLERTRSIAAVLGLESELGDLMGLLDRFEQAA